VPAWAGVAAAGRPSLNLLRSPKDGAKLKTPPRLVWTRNAEANYYNVQLFRGQAKILSTWPVSASVRLKRTWKYQGRRYTLAKGVYRWYVWPGFGARAKVDYGELLGSAEQAESFRFGGDEFAVIFSRDEIGAYRQLEEIQRQLVQVDASPGGPVTISAGIATFPSHAQDADELQRRADGALYWSKEHGKNRSCLYSPSVVRIYSRDALERETERSARLRAAKNLVRFVDARDAQTANHSELVSALA
jgi:hypothetical protein